MKVCERTGKNEGGKNMGCGFIMKSTQYCIYCYDCDEFEDYEEITRPTTVYKKRGWRKGSDNNWRCSKCHGKKHGMKPSIIR